MLKRQNYRIFEIADNSTAEMIFENPNPTEAERELWKYGFFLVSDEPLADPSAFDFEPPHLYRYGRSQAMDIDSSTIEKVVLRAPKKYLVNPFEHWIEFYCDANIIDASTDIEASAFIGIVQRALELNMMSWYKREHHLDKDQSLKMCISTS